MSTYTLRVIADDLGPELPAGTLLEVDPDAAPRAGDWVLIGQTVERYEAGPVDGVVIQAGRRYR